MWEFSYFEGTYDAVNFELFTYIWKILSTLQNRVAKLFEKYYLKGGDLLTMSCSDNFDNDLLN
jgi:hypothetical protein